MYHNQIRTPLSSSCQLRLGVVLRHLSLSPYMYTTYTYFVFTSIYKVLCISFKSFPLAHSLIV